MDTPKVCHEYVKGMPWICQRCAIGTPMAMPGVHHGYAIGYANGYAMAVSLAYARHSPIPIDVQGC